MANYRDCPIYATAKFKLLWMGNDALIVCLVTIILTRGLGALASLIIGITLGIMTQRYMDRSGLPDGYVPYQLSLISVHPFVRKYLPFISEFAKWMWHSAGSLPPTGYYKRYTR